MTLRMDECCALILIIHSRAVLLNNILFPSKYGLRFKQLNTVENQVRCLIEKKQTLTACSVHFIYSD